MSEVTVAERLYDLEARPTRKTLVFGLSIEQMAALGVASIVGVALAHSGDPLAIVIALGIVGFAAYVSLTFPKQEQLPRIELLPREINFHVIQPLIRRRGVHMRSLPLKTQYASSADDLLDRRPAHEVPRILDGTEMGWFMHHGNPVGAVFNVRERRLTGVIRVTNQRKSNLLADQQEMQAEINFYLSLLKRFCESSATVVRLCWTERQTLNVSDVYDSNGKSYADRLATSSHPMADLARKTLETLQENAIHRELLFAISIGLDKAAERIVNSGGAEVGAFAVLGEELDGLVSMLKARGIESKPLSPYYLAKSSRLAFNPYLRPYLEDWERTWAKSGQPAPVLSPWPWELEGKRDHCETDDSDHVTLWAALMPSELLRADFMNSLLGEKTLGILRTVSMVMEPVSEAEANDRLARARVEARSVQKQRESQKREMTEKERRLDARLKQWEADAAAGNPGLNFSMYLTISTPHDESPHKLGLHRAVGEIRQMVGRSGISLQPLLKQHDWGLVLANPLFTNLGF